MDQASSPTALADLKPGPVCSVCPLYSVCTAICEPVESLLPSMERGRIDAEDLPKLYFGTRLTHALLDHPHLLTPRQQEVVRLYYRETLRQQDIARLLEISQQAVQDTLQRARATVGNALTARAGRTPDGTPDGTRDSTAEGGAESRVPRA